jgi:hypothetical protein
MIDTVVEGFTLRAVDGALKILSEYPKFSNHL